MEEDNFFGKTTPQEPSPERLTATFVDNPKTKIKLMDWQVSASGYAAVWATDNTRESIWDAMQRKETYATTGSRMAVRFFGGWEFEHADAENRNPGVIGYGKDVPMGGDLRTAPEGRVPTFLVAALQDPLGANLDRYQIMSSILTEAAVYHSDCADMVRDSFDHADRYWPLGEVVTTTDNGRFRLGSGQTYLTHPFMSSRPRRK